VEGRSAPQTTAQSWGKNILRDLQLLPWVGSCAVGARARIAHAVTIQQIDFFILPEATGGAGKAGLNPGQERANGTEIEIVGSSKVASL